MKSTPALFAAWILIAGAGPAGSQDTLQTVRDLYASAAYEDALAALTRLQSVAPGPEVDQYRVFCLIALGRTDQAEKAIAAVVTADPTYTPDANEVSPRIREIFTRTRQKLLPNIGRTMYADAKAALDRKERAEAIAKFESLIRLIDESDVGREGTLGELRLLASGFLDLARATPAPQPEPAAPSTSAAQPAPVAELRPPVVKPPVAIKQEMPPWVPVDAVSRAKEFNGAVRVVISTTGKVESAEIVRSVHPAYDGALLKFAREWVYQPAMQAGIPVASEQTVQVQLKPRQD